MATVTTLALTAALSAAALLVTGCGGSDAGVPEAAAPSAAPVVTGDFRCPDPHAGPASIADRGSAELPTGATSARLCRLDNRDPWVAPRGVLTRGLGQLVEVVNAQHVHHPGVGTGCGGVGAPAWAIVLRYRDGIRTITGDNGGCWDLLVGGVEHGGSDHVFYSYVDALLDQRHAEGPPTSRVAPPRCPDGSYPATSPAADARALRSAVWCRREGRRYTPAGTVTAPQLAVLRHDIRTYRTRQLSRRARSRSAGCATPARAAAPLLMGRDAWGDPVAVTFACRSYQVLWVGHPGLPDVRMLPATLAAVARLEQRRPALRP